MRYSFRLQFLLAVMILAACLAVLAQAPTYNLGRTPTAEEIGACCVVVGPEGKELPPGSGTAKQGAPIYAQKCAVCHGPTGTEGPYVRLVSSKEGVGETPPQVAVNNSPRGIILGWMYATTIWDYVKRAMPPDQAGSLSADEVYALTAFLLYRCDIIEENVVMDANSLPKVQMPNRGYDVPLPPGYKHPSGGRNRTP